MLVSRRTRHLALLVALIAAGVAAAPAAAQSAGETGVVAGFRATPDDPDFAGRTVVMLRTEAALPLNVVGLPRTPARLGRERVQLLTVSRELHCYAIEVDVFRRGGPRRTAGRVGDRVRVQVGRGGSVLDRRVEVQALTPEIARGGILGCGDDPGSTAILFNMYPTPLVEPGRFFFTANSGPYLKDLVWSGWGTPTATATGTYVSDCASCGPKQEYAVTVTADRLVDCPPYGAQAYDRLRFERAGGPAPGDPRRRQIAGEADVYC